MWFFTFAFSVFMLCAFWLGTVFSSFFATIYKYEKTTSTTSFFDLFLIEQELRTSKAHPKWSSFSREGITQMTKLRVPFTISRSLTCFHSLTPRCSLTAHFFFFFWNTRSNCALSVFFCCFASINTGTNFDLFNCLCFMRPLFLVSVCLWRFENHGYRITCCKISNFKPIAKIWTDLETLCFVLLLLLLLLSSVVTHLKLSSHAEFRKENHDCCCCCFPGIAFDTSHTSSKTQEPPGATPAAGWISLRGRIYTVPRSSP